jgi:signal transduction histidine kinase
MPSPKTEADRSEAGRWARFDPRSPTASFRRLNTRLVFALSIGALVGLLVSGLAINQILPGYFAEQTQQRIETVAGSSAIVLRQRVDQILNSPQRTILSAAETRDQLVVAPVVPDLARIFSATITVLTADERVVASASPDNVTSLEDQGLRRDTDVRPTSARVAVELPFGLQTEYIVVVSDPYSTRQATLQQIRSALVGAGVLALVVSLVTGIIAARGLTVPISRLRGVAGRVAQGHLDERAVPSGVLEIDELGQQFNVMADRLAGTLRVLEADRDRLREFVADVSHELRTPIAALRMYTELQTSGEVDDEATRREFLERSIEQIARLEWLSTNLLDLSRIDAGIFPLDMRDGDVRDPVQAVVQALSDTAVTRGVALDSVVPAQPVEMRFDRERIVQLMTNLIGNALKFTPRGGAVAVRVDEAPEEVTIEVSDTGHGIPADELPRIFDRFYRGTNTGDARASGSGLGLAIVRSIVDMHGGRIDLSSDVGKGTVFRIVLPRGGVPVVAEDEAKVNETSRGHRPARNPGTVA